MSREPAYEKKSNARVAAEKLGAKLARCTQCSGLYVFDADETYSVTVNPPGGDYDEGNSRFLVCCSHACAARTIATLPSGIIWRGGKCGGTLLGPAAP